MTVSMTNRNLHTLTSLRHCVNSYKQHGMRGNTCWIDLLVKQSIAFGILIIVFHELRTRVNCLI